MIKIASPDDINWENLRAIAYHNASLELDETLLKKVDAGRITFLKLIENGLPCYGVTTGLGKLVSHDLTDKEREDLPANMLRARAAAIGPPLAKPIARAILVLRLVNFLTGLDAVSSNLCRYLVARLNDGFTPWIPSLGHGMASDAIANAHAFQTLIGEGYVFSPDPDTGKLAARDALARLDVEPCVLVEKEGLALIGGITASPAYAFDAHRCLTEILTLANMVAAVSIEGLAAPKDAVSPMILTVSYDPGLKNIVDDLQRYLANSQIAAFKLQAPVSYRVIPQVHAAMWAALEGLRDCIEACFAGFSANPLMVEDDSAEGGRFLSVGLFHNQHLVNQLEHVAIAFAHIGCLSERRLHRLLNPENTGLNAQLAARPGLDAGLVVTQKASLDLAARLRLLAQPVSLFTSESSGGQEDYMALAFPAIARLYDMADLVKAMLAYELLAGLIAVGQRESQAGDGVIAVGQYFQQLIKPLNKDRAPGPDVELILQAFDSASFIRLVNDL